MFWMMDDYREVFHPGLKQAAPLVEMSTGPRDGSPLSQLHASSQCDSGEQNVQKTALVWATTAVCLCVSEHKLHICITAALIRWDVVDRESGCSSLSSPGPQLWDATVLYFKGQGQKSLRSAGSYGVMTPIRRLLRTDIQSLSIWLFRLQPAPESQRE